jgi:hypothetical protein
VTYDEEKVSGFKYILMYVLHNREMKKLRSRLETLREKLMKLI